MKIVLDSNILISSIITDGICNEILHHVIREHTLCLSEFILSETERKLIGKLYFAEERVKNALLLIRNESEIVDPIELKEPVSRDPKDDSILGTALTAQAELLVSGDKDLLVIGQYEGFSIVTPKTYQLNYIRNPIR